MAKEYLVDVPGDPGRLHYLDQIPHAEMTQVVEVTDKDRLPASSAPNLASGGERGYPDGSECYRRSFAPGVRRTQGEKAQEGNGVDWRRP